MSPEPEFERILEEILNRRSGEQPTLEEYVAKYPQHKTQLAEQFETLRVLEELMREEGAAPPPTRSSTISYCWKGSATAGWVWCSSRSRCHSREMWH